MTALSQSTTLQEHLYSQNARTDVRQSVLAIADACQKIAHALSIGDALGDAGNTNIQGESQKKLDVLANDLLIDALQNCQSVYALASEELDVPVDAHQDGTLLALFDPLDGSSNIDIQGLTGTIFSLLDAQGGFLQQGRAQLCAGYALYSSSTMFVLCLNGRVDMFCLIDGQFILTKSNIKIDKDTKEYAINSSNYRFWEQPMRDYVDSCTTGVRGNFNTRWIAAMVADVHRILCRGGVFAYPIDEKIRSKGGKLRLMYEANPMALIIECAGGMASDTKGLILDIAPKDIHQRVPVVLGATNEVSYIQDLHAHA